MNNNFNERLAYAMKYRGLKQIDIVNKLKINKSLISMYLSGDCKPKTEKLYSLANLLNVNPIWLAGYTAPMIEEAQSNNEITLSNITELLSKLQDYIDLYMSEGRCKENAISRLAEAVFWVTYGDDLEKEE